MKLFSKVFFSLLLCITCANCNVKEETKIFISESAIITNKATTNNISDRYIPDIMYSNTKRSIDFINETCPIEGIMRLDKNWVYSRHINEDNGNILYCLYLYGEPSAVTTLSQLFYTNKWYTEEDFRFIKKGSTLEDVNAIDESTIFKLSCPSSYSTTLHLTFDGYVRITWSDADKVEDMKVIDTEVVQEHAVALMYAKEKIFFEYR